MAAIFRTSLSIRNLYQSCRHRITFISRKNLYLRHSETASAKVVQYPPACYLFSRHFATQEFQHEFVEEDPKPVQGRLQSLDRILYKIDMDARRIGRISKKNVENIFEEIKILGTASSTQSLLLIRCCGSLLQEELPSVRNIMVNNIWNKLLELNFQLDVSHYNALLKVYLENKQEFSPIEFLSMMENKGVSPNRVTYQRLVEKYCHDGDISGASKILEFMKEKGIAINEMVFNSLIIGHSKANDMQSAKNMLEVMCNSELDPSSTTYAILVCGYAEKGDIEAVRQTLLEAEQKDIHLLDKDYLDITAALANGGHCEYIDEIISKCRKLVGYNQDCINAILDLVNKDQVDVAYKLLLTMPPNILPDGHQAPAGTFFIKQLVKTEKPIDKIMEFCKDLKNRGLNVVALSTAAEASLLYQKTDYALTFIEKMHEEEFPIRCHYFWPILIAYQQEGNIDGIWSTLKTMNTLGGSANYETYTDYVFPGLSMVDPDGIIQKVKEIGQTVGSVVNPLIHYYLSVGDAKTAISLTKNYPVRLNPSLLVRILASCYKATNDTESVVQLLDYMIFNADQGAARTDWAGQFLLEYIYNCNNDVSGVEPLLKAMLDKGMKLSQASIDAASNKLHGKKTETLSRVLEQMPSSKSSYDVQEEYSFSHPRDMDVEKLENHLIELKSKGLHTRGVLRHLLLAHCKKRNVDRVSEIKAELEEQKLVFTPAMYSQLMDLYSSTNNLEEAEKYRNLVNQLDPTFKIDTFKIINFAALLVSNGRSQEAINFIKKHCVQIPHYDQPNFLERNVWRILNAAAERGDVEALQSLFDVTVDELKLVSPTNNIVGPLVKVHLIREDIDSALEAFERCKDKYRFLPWKKEILKILIQKEDSERLQKVMDLCTEIHGEMNTMYDLACAFIECGQIRQARKIIETPGLRARQQRIDDICSRYIEQNMVVELEHFVDITRDLFEVNRDKMFFHLLRLYAKNNDYQKALGLWTTIQEENIQPSVETLIFLADLLEKNKQPVPFVVPPRELYQRDTTSSPDGVGDLQSCINDGSIDEALNIKRKLEENGVKLNQQILSSMIEALVQKDRLKEAADIAKNMLNKNVHPTKRILKYLILQLSRAGDVETIRAFEDSLPLTLQRDISFGNSLSKALVVSGRQEELLTEMEQNIGKNNASFPYSGILLLLQNNPEYRDRVTKIADDCMKLNVFGPKNVVWMHYFTNEDYETADKIYQSCPEFKDNLMFRSVLNEIRKGENETMARKLIDIVKTSNLSGTAKGLAYSSLLNVLVTKRNLEEALAVIEEAKEKEILLTDFNRHSLIRLKQALLEEGKVLPFEIPEVQKASAISDSDSDSSDEERR